MAPRDPVARREYNRKYRAERREALNARQVERYHAEGGKEKNRAYRQGRLSQYAAYQRAARQRNPREALVSQAVSRARRDGLPYDITVDTLAWPSHCPVLGLELDYNRTPAGDRKIRSNSPTLDRHVNELGYVAGNVFVISHRANRIKSDATPDELRRVAAYAAGVILPPRF